MAVGVLALLGGDKRELELIPALTKIGWQMQVYGLPAGYLPEGVKVFAEIREALAGADILILPVPGIRNDGFLHAPFLPPCKVDEQDLRVLAPGTTVVTGIVSPYLRQLAELCRLNLVETMELDEVAVPNAVPTAEGAIQVAMGNLPITINNSRVLVIGYGRVGQALAKRLAALNAKVTVVNRSEDYRLAKARDDGFVAVDLQDLAGALSDAQVIFNTAPALVLTKEILSKINSSTLIIDLAAIPGGTDWQAAENLGLKTIHALSLPGKVAPVTAGQILAASYPNVLAQIKKSQLNKAEKEVL